MTDPLREIERLERQEALRLWRNGFLMAGIVLCAIAGTALVSSAGVVTWLALPLLALGAVFLVVGWVLAMLLAREP